jgi:AraC family transcriptional regulator of adaptative response/methylated-DNA-[protein]-cysteine methyltransferase
MPIDPDAAWQQILARDRDAEFIYGVTTTGVFCRPGCASRRPLRKNVRIFSTETQARTAGFRPCKRCCGTIASREPVSEIRNYIESHADRAVSLAELAKLVKLSPFTVQRLFKQQMGVSPLQYQRALRAGALRGALKQGETVTNAIYNAGFSSSSRAYEGSQLGMTPARFAQGGRGETIAWCSAPSPFGWILVGATHRGLCWLSLAATKAEAEATLRAEFGAAALQRDPTLSKFVESALAKVSKRADQRTSVPLDLRGTAFQLRVWQALCSIPRGQTKSYSELAKDLGNPNAARAVARACATNRVALIVPCHRVVGVSGSLTGYRWGVERKKNLLAAERT